MKAFFNSSTWIIISAIFSVFGLIGTILGFYQYLKSSKELGEYKYLFKIAGQHVDLEDKKSQINDYENRIEHMQKTINEQIPVEAKKIALKGILDNELQVLSSTYTKVKSLQSELETLTSEDTLETEELMKNVNKVIEPVYSLKRSNSLLSTVFYLVSVASSFLSMILPYSIYQMIIVIVLLFQLIIGTRSIINLLKLNYTHNELNNIIHKALLIGAIIFLIVSLFLIFLLLCLFKSMSGSINELPFLIISAIFFAVYLILGYLFFIKENKKKLIIWLILSFVSLILMVTFILSLEPVFIILGFCISLINIVFLCACLNNKKTKQNGDGR